VELIRQALDIFFHMDVHLTEWMNLFGAVAVYTILFLIIFCETGLVVTPFLPGDSILFAAGALARIDGSPLSVWWLFFLLAAAAVLGNTSNFYIGRWVGPKVFNRESSILLNKKHLIRAQKFYEKYGGRAIVLARFVPIIRTFAPFVAGVGKMQYRRFGFFNLIGGISWVALFIGAGAWFGNQPFIKRNFHYVIVAIIVISVMPAVVEFLRARKEEQSTVH